MPQVQLWGEGHLKFAVHLKNIRGEDGFFPERGWVAGQISVETSDICFQKCPQNVTTVLVFGLSA